MNQHHWLIVLAFVSLSLTSLLRFCELDGMLIWHDEVYSLSRVLGIPHQQTLETLHDGEIHAPSELLKLQTPQGDVSFDKVMGALKEHPEHGPLYYLIGWAVVDWTEKPIVALRGASAVLSLLLFPAVFWLARELGDRRYAWLALTLAAASPLYFLYAREARQYIFWLVLITAASAALLRLLRHNRGRDYLLYIGLLMLALYTHLMTGLIILAHALFVAVMYWRQRPVLAGIGQRLLLAWGVVLVSFVPWLLVIYEQKDNFQRFTGWMSRSTSLTAMVKAWEGHVTRLFVDLPGAEHFWLAGGISLLLVALYHFRRAPRPQRIFIAVLIVTQLAFVILPDLLIGGRRSLETRYLLPLLLALQLMVAWAFSSGLSGGQRAIRGATQALLILVLAGGLYSQYVITQADQWWTKSLSAENAGFARLVNASSRPLIVGSYADTSGGEILSLAHLLDDHVRVLMENPARPIEIPSGYSRLFALLPSDRLRAQLEKTYAIEPYPGSWKWFVLSPRE